MNIRTVICLAALAATLALAACAHDDRNPGMAGQPGANSSAATDGTVHMDNTFFKHSRATLHAGQSLTLTADTFVPHIIASGSWANGTPQPAHEAGAPTVNDLNIPGSASASIGPFNATGTFHFYCTLHPAMNLEVVVQ